MSSSTVAALDIVPQTPHEEQRKEGKEGNEGKEGKEGKEMDKEEKENDNEEKEKEQNQTASVCRASNICTDSELDSGTDESTDSDKGGGNEEKEYKLTRRRVRRLLLKKGIKEGKLAYILRQTGITPKELQFVTIQGYVRKWFRGKQLHHIIGEKREEYVFKGVTPWMKKWIASQRTTANVGEKKRVSSDTEPCEEEEQKYGPLPPVPCEGEDEGEDEEEEEKKAKNGEKKKRGRPKKKQKPLTPQSLIDAVEEKRQKLGLQCKQMKAELNLPSKYSNWKNPPGRPQWDVIFMKWLSQSDSESVDGHSEENGNQERDGKREEKEEAKEGKEEANTRDAGEESDRGVKRVGTKRRYRWRKRREIEEGDSEDYARVLSDTRIKRRRASRSLTSSATYAASSSSAELSPTSQTRELTSVEFEPLARTQDSRSVELGISAQAPINDEDRRLGTLLLASSVGLAHSGPNIPTSPAIVLSHSESKTHPLLPCSSSSSSASLTVGIHNSCAIASSLASSACSRRGQHVWTESSNRIGTTSLLSSSSFAASPSSLSSSARSPSFPLEAKTEYRRLALSLLSSSDTNTEREAKLDGKQRANGHSDSISSFPIRAQRGFPSHSDIDNERPNCVSPVVGTGSAKARRMDEKLNEILERMRREGKLNDTQFDFYANIFINESITFQELQEMHDEVNSLYQYLYTNIFVGSSVGVRLEHLRIFKKYFLEMKPHPSSNA